MIRQPWLAHFKAPLAKPLPPLPSSRRLSSTVHKPPPHTFPRSHLNDKKDAWKVPRAKPAKGDKVDEFAEWRTSRLHSESLSPLEEKSRKGLARRFSKTGTGGHMLVVEGLSTNLRASDFSRLAARDLSDWQTAINEVSQERDPWTLDPLGTYSVSFSSQAAATLYRSKVDRVFRIAQHKLRSHTGLWISTLPDHLRSPDVPPHEEVDLFTLAPGTLPDAPRVRTSRVKGGWPWQRLLSKLIHRSGYTVEPAAVLLDLENSPKSLVSAAELEAFIRDDGVERDEPWAVSMPYPLTRSLNDNELGRGSHRVPPTNDKVFNWKLRCRHVIICETPDVAWRFIRRWNRQNIWRGYGDDRIDTMVNASYIEL